MAMTGSGLKNAIIAALDALSDEDKKDRGKAHLAYCNALVAYIQANAVVNTTVAVASVSLVTPGGSASGPGAGTGVGTVL